MSFEELRDRSTLHLVVFDFDKFSHDEAIGEATVDFSATDVSTAVELWCEIEPITQVSSTTAAAEVACGVLVRVSYDGCGLSE